MKGAGLLASVASFLDSEDPVFRFNATYLVIQYGDKRLIEEKRDLLRENLKLDLKDGDKENRINGLKHIFLLGDDDSIACAIPLFFEHDTGVRKFAARLIENHSKKDADFLSIQKALKSLRNCSESKIPDEKATPRVVRMVLSAVSFADDSAKNELLGILAIRAPTSHAQVAEAISNLLKSINLQADPRIKASLLEALDFAVLLLVKKYDPAAVPFIRKFFLSEHAWPLFFPKLRYAQDPREMAMFYASRGCLSTPYFNDDSHIMEKGRLLKELEGVLVLMGLTSTKGASISGSITSLLNSDDAVFRSGAFELLRDYIWGNPSPGLNSKSVLPELVDLVNTSQNPRARALALELLCESTDAKQHASLFAKCLKDAGEDSKQRSIRVAAIYALAKIGDDDSINLLAEPLASKDFLVHETAIDVLSKVSEPEFEKLVPALIKDQDPVLRASAYRLIGSRGDKNYSGMIFSGLLFGKTESAGAPETESDESVLFHAKPALEKTLPENEQKQFLLAFFERFVRDDLLFHIPKDPFDCFYSATLRFDTARIDAAVDDSDKGSLSQLLFMADKGFIHALVLMGEEGTHFINEALHSDDAVQRGAIWALLRIHSSGFRIDPFIFDSLLEIAKGATVEGMGRFDSVYSDLLELVHVIPTENVSIKKARTILQELCDRCDKDASLRDW